MKLRDFFDEPKKLKKVTVIPKTTKKVIIKNTKQYYFGFGLNKKILKDTHDYIRSWLIRYNVPFKSINPYLTLYILDNILYTYSIINEIESNKTKNLYKPKGTITVINNDDKDYIVLDYVVNNDYKNKLEKIFKSKNINIISKHCYVKLFEVKTNVLKNRVYEDIMFSCPSLPNIKTGNVGLLLKRGNK